MYGAHGYPNGLSLPTFKDKSFHASKDKTKSNCSVELAGVALKTPVTITGSLNPRIWQLSQFCQLHFAMS